MIVDIEITFKDRDKDGVITKRTQTYRVDSEDVPLILVEEQSVNLMRAAIADYLELTEPESRQLTMRHIKQIGEAMRAAQDIPNGSGRG